MKLATIADGGEKVLCVVDQEAGRLLKLGLASTTLEPGAAHPFLSMIDLLDGGDRALDTARLLVEKWPEVASQALSGAKLLSPLPVPRQIRDCLVFEQHLLNAMAQWEKMTGKPSSPISPAWYQRPTYYKGNIYSVVGPEEDVIWPPYSEQMDYELELACVVGKPSKDVSVEQAAANIFGYTIFNDFSSRDMQVVERPFGMGPMKSKDFDTGNVLGPWIVTADEIGDPKKLNMEVRVNGERRGGGNSADMHHRFDQILSFMSVSETVHPGTVVASGTVGTGCGLESGEFLRPMDVVELEIERIGVLRNRIIRP